MISARLTFILAAACGLIVANIYYVQPVAGVIGFEFGIDPSAVGLLVTFTQIGYGLGLVLVVPLGDILENRRLVVTSLALSVLALLGMVFAPSGGAVLAASLLIGLTCVAAQVIVPFAAHLASDASRGRVVGEVVSGLLLGVMLARPASSFLTHWFGWRAIFAASAAVMAALSLVLLRTLPQWRSKSPLSYFEILGSMFALARDTPVLRRRAAYQAPLFAAFSLFWTATPVLLAGPRFGLTQQGIGLFALVGAGGALVAPIAGRAADRGWTQVMTGISLAAAVLSFCVAWIGGTTGSITLLVIAAIVLDMAVQANLVLSQRAIFALGDEARSRLNGIFMATFFMGGAIGSALSTLTLANGGWPLASSTGIGITLVAFLYYLTELSLAGRAKND
jgi:predicted MFS family arabinose efflux permease